MKWFYLLSIIIFAENASAQPSNRAQVTSLLNWLIEAHHIEYLAPKTSDAVFYRKDYLTMKAVLNPDNQIDTSETLSDYLTNEEILTCTVALPAKQTNLQIWYKQLPVAFTTGIKSELKLFEQQKTLYIFSNPLWLNKKATRVLIGEYFACVIACGRGDIMLCEFKDGKWRLIARALVTND